MLPSLVDALESGDDWDNVCVQCSGQTLATDVADLRLTVHGVSQNRHLAAEKGTRWYATFLQCHAHQSDGDLLTGRQQHVELAWLRVAP